MTLFRLLNTEAFAAPEARRRVWMEPGMPVVLVPGVVAMQDFARRGDAYAAELWVSWRGGDWRGEVPEGAALNLWRRAGVLLVPRAVEHSALGRPQRLLLEVLAAEEAQAWAR